MEGHVAARVTGDWVAEHPCFPAIVHPEPTSTHQTVDRQATAGTAVYRVLVVADLRARTLLCGSTDDLPAAFLASALLYRGSAAVRSLRGCSSQT